MLNKASKATSPDELSLNKLSLSNTQEDQSVSNPSFLNPSFLNPPFLNPSSESPSSKNPPSGKQAPRKRTPKKNSGGNPPSPEDGFSKKSAPETTIAETGTLKNIYPENTALEKISANRTGAKKRRSKKRAPDKHPAWSMWPMLDDQVREQLEQANLNYTFHTHDTDRGTIESYDTNIMGRFSCYNQNCNKQSWSSMKIAITIRLYPGHRYNARVYHQRCDGCKTLGKPTIDEESYIDRVSYRIKKWNGVSMERPAFGGESKGPHIKSLCEGCKNGHCTG